MGNGCTKRAGLGPLHVHMNPLVVSSGLCKEVDLLLGDGDPIADNYFLPNQGRHFCKGLYGFHASHCRATRAYWLSSQRQSNAMLATWNNYPPG